MPAEGIGGYARSRAIETRQVVCLSEALTSDHRKPFGPLDARLSGASLENREIARHAGKFSAHRLRSYGDREPNW
jgi:hypothetical protein